MNPFIYRCDYCVAEMDGLKGVARRVHAKLVSSKHYFLLLDILRFDRPCSFLPSVRGGEKGSKLQQDRKEKKRKHKLRGNLKELRFSMTI